MRKLYLCGWNFLPYISQCLNLQFGKDIGDVLQELEHRCTESTWAPQSCSSHTSSSNQRLSQSVSLKPGLRRHSSVDDYRKTYSHLNTKTYRIKFVDNYDPNRYTSFRNSTLTHLEKSLMWERISSPRKSRQQRPVWIPRLDLSWVDEDY